MSRKIRFALLVGIFPMLGFALPRLTAPASTWKTYRSKSIGFQIAYPSNLTPRKENGNPATMGFIDRKLLGTDCFDFEVQVHPRGTMSEEEAIQDSHLFWTKKQAQSYYKETPRMGPFPFAAAPDDTYFIDGSELDPGVHPVREMTVNGNPAWVGEQVTKCWYNDGRIADSEPGRVVFLLGKRQYAVINTMGKKSDTDKMLASFRFIEPGSDTP